MRVVVSINRITLLATLTALTALFLVGASSASAGPAWKITSLSNPTAAPGGQAQYTVYVRNAGDQPAPAEVGGNAGNCAAAPPPGAQPAKCATFVARFPEGLTPSAVQKPAPFSACNIDLGPDGSTVTCSAPGHSPQFPPFQGSGTPIIVAVDVAADASGPLTTSFEMSGAGATLTSTADAIEVTPAVPQFGIAEFDGQVSAGPSGAALTQAGGRPYSASTSIEFYSITSPDPTLGHLLPLASPRSFIADLPPGFVGDPTSVDRCSLGDLANGNQVFSNPLCAPTSQVGAAAIRTVSPFGQLFSPVPVFNMEPPPGSPARFGFVLLGAIVLLDVEVRTEGDYGVSVITRRAPQALPVQGVSLTLWGLPADDSEASGHFPERACPGAPSGQGGPVCKTGTPLKALLRNPTSCDPDPGVGLPTTLRVDTWENPGDFHTRTFFSHLPPAYPAHPDDWGAQAGPTGCDMVPFNPSFAGAAATGARADKPGGVGFDLGLPQSSDPTAIATSDLRKAVVTLPRGLRVNPASADGLGGCSSAQIDLGSRAAPSCPPSSKIASLSVETPLLEKPLTGAAYLATPLDNPFGSLLAVYLVAEGSGVVLKLPGEVRTGEDGRLTASFDDNPQLPFSNLRLQLKDGPRAPLTLPDECGDHAIESTFTGWNGEVVSLTSPFTVSGSCEPEGFSPKLGGGLRNPIAGSMSPFALRLTREDSDQELSSLDVSVPPGLTAVLRGVPTCPQSALDAVRAMSAIGQGATEIASPACPAASQVGTATVGAGAGTSPFYVQTGRVYLAGPYKGAPLSLAVVAPAVAGPFDLGNVVVQTAVHIDPVTARITAKSDQIPAALHGIPLDLRDLRVDLDRPDFTLAPTSCAETSIDATVRSTKGSTASPSQRMQLADCASLGFRPHLRLRLKGSTRRASNPRLIAVLKARPGDANIARAQVKLPRAALLDNDHIKTICTRVQFAANQCPPGSVYGRAMAVTPLLDRPLSGPVYLRSSNNTLPDLVAALRGPDSQPIEVELSGRTDAVRGALRNTFDLVPDAPVSSFRLELFGGRRGLVEIGGGFCKNRRAVVKLDGQNGKVHDFSPRVQAKCGSGSTPKRRR